MKTSSITPPTRRIVRTQAVRSKKAPATAMPMRMASTIRAATSPDMSTSDSLAEGETFEGPSKTLTDAHFLLFSGVTGDVHPSHYDVEYAKKTRFGKPLAHGLLLASMTALGASNARERIDGF